MALCMCVMKQVNDAVFRAYPKEIKDWTPTIQIVFFHGLTRPEQEDSYIMTWTTMLESGDAGVCWPAVWLPSRFSGAGIYLVSYDSSRRTDAQNGRSDLFGAAESVLWNLLDAGIGQFSQCPVILVGHDLGGLLIKKICCDADRSGTRSGRRARKALFLKQLKGIYFLAVPHSGIPLSEDRDQRSKIYAAMAELGEEVARLNHLFRDLEHSWKSFTVYATHAHETEPHYCLKEASARNGADVFLSIATDGEQITRPKDENSGCFPSLRDFIEDVLSEFKSQNVLSRKRQEKYERPRLPFTRDPLYVPIEGTIQKVKEYLLTEKVVLVCGEAGIGKTSLAKYLALEYEDDFKKQKGDEAVFRHGCCFVECGPGVEVVKVQRALLYRLLGKNRARKYDRQDDPRILKQVLEDHLQELDVLIILDNLWDDYLLECLVVDGKMVKYLVTGQQCHRQRVDSCEVKICRMDDIGEDYGKKIFARRMRFQDGLIPENLQCIVIKILEETGCNPLALDTLSLTVREKRRTETREWLEILKHIHLYLERSGHSDTSTTYPRGFFASMMFAVERLTDGRRSITCYSPRKGPVVSVREKIDSHLFGLSSSGLSAQALGFLYGESNTRAKIAAHRGISASRLSSRFRTLEAARELLLPFVPSFANVNRFHHRSNKARRKMFKELVLEGKLQTEVISELFDTPSSEFNASRVLMELFLAMNPGFLAMDAESSFDFSHSDDAFGPVDESMWQELQKSIEDTACITNRMYASTAGSRPYLKLGPGAIEAMVTSLSAINSRTEEAQFEAIAIFAFTVLASDDPKSLFVFDATESLLGVLQGDKEPSSGSKVDGVNLVRLSEILVLLALRHGFINGLQMDATLLESYKFKVLVEKAMTTLVVQRALEFDHRSLSRCALRTITHIVYQLKAASWPRPRKFPPEVLEKLDSIWKDGPLLAETFAIVKSEEIWFYGGVSGYQKEVLSFLNHSHLARSLVTYCEDTITVRVLTVKDSGDRLFTDFRCKLPSAHTYRPTLLDISAVLNLGPGKQHLMGLDTEETLACIRKSHTIVLGYCKVNV
ncbi:hypothetical protein R1sor_013692 [Riccia sorocarpa]|uniref:ORC1/DEAH AAA+ ATPase domain-containing protein n=1 Tax=Riccia sorocarpa TaxID=122646 RepID=A0ABD3H7X1_9MARC